MPTTRGGSAGSFFSRLTRRSSVSGLVVIPMRAARRAPASPPRDEPMSVWVCRSRSVARARGAANPGRRSAKMRRGQSDCGHTKRRTATLQPHAPAETGQVVEPAGVPAAHAAGVGAADGARRRGGGDRQVDGEVLDIETGTDEAAPFGSAQQLERKHQGAPGAFFGTG